MNATQHRTLTEAHIVNGRANLNYTFEQFMALPEEARVKWLTFANVDSRLQLPMQEILTDHEQLFWVVKKALTVDAQDAPVVAEVNSRKIYSAAEGMTLLAYGDSNSGEAQKIKCRSLSYKVECSGFGDLVNCLTIIDSYNAFAAGKAIQALKDYGRAMSFYSETNPNNGKDIFKYYVARESSPAIYISFNEYYKPSKEVSRNGAEVTYCEQTSEDFKEQMAMLSSISGADEFSIEEFELFGTGVAKVFTARFCWD